MITIDEIRTGDNKILVLGNHTGIIQSMLDFDFLSGKKEPSVFGIVGNSAGFSKFFWGNAECLIPVYAEINGRGVDSRLRGNDKERGNDNHRGNDNVWFLNLLSGRRMLSSTAELMNITPHFSGGVYFAENVPEQHSISVYHEAVSRHLLSIGPASVGLLVPGVLKLGPIGGITPTQIQEARLTEAGTVAVMSASGGMTNELINSVVQTGNLLSFAVSFGGDRFPILSPEGAFLLAEEDPLTKTVLFYGELGGDDEYRLIKLKESGKFTKRAIIHIAGTVADLFAESPQFGHAKARAEKGKERARSKRDALRSAGFVVTEKFGEITKEL